VRPSLFEFAGGQTAFLALAAAHHARCLADPELNHPFSHPGQHPRHVERLAAYWAEVLGGPSTYSRSCGDQSGLLHMHAGNGDMGDLGERFLKCFESAMDDADLPPDPEFRACMRAYMRWAIDDVLVYSPVDAVVPRGAAMPRWGWHGLERMDRDELNAHLDRVLIGGREPQRIRLVEHRAEWADRFRRERERVVAAAGDIVQSVEHIGSTAVPDLAAKPIVDILVTVAEPSDPALASALERAGYLLRVDEPGHRMFRTPDRDVHVHVWPVGDLEVHRYLAFRDRLRSSARDRRAYEQLKRALAERDWEDLNHYAQAKGALVEAILRRAR
jgi:hemoglobin